MGKLVTSLLQFSRRSQRDISTVDVCLEIKKTIELVDYHFRKNNVTLALDFSPDVPQILSDHQQLKQLFLNLFVNASDAMPQGGTLTIRVAPVSESKEICIEISDTGTGIPPEIIHKVFEPFYTTKPEGKGTGLGLAICRRIVEEQGGKLEITSEGIPGRGTKARITLPVAEQGNEAGYLKP
jgi:signal transduction histidine kinase